MSISGEQATSYKAGTCRVTVAACDGFDPKDPSRTVWRLTMNVTIL